MQYKCKAKDVVKIIGLEYICQCYGKSYNSIAEELGISRQSINGWLKGTRLIPVKHLPKMAEIFELPEEYFQKELSDEEIEKVKKKKIDFDITKIVNVLMEVEEIKNTIEGKTIEEQIDYVEVLYNAVIDIIYYFVTKKTSKMLCDDLGEELMSMKKEEEKDINEILSIVKELMYEDKFDFKKFKQYIKDYK